MTVGGSVTWLIAQAKAGDEAAFAAIHRRYWPKVAALAGSRLKNAPPMPVDAEDIAQRAFIGLHLSFMQSQLPALTTRHQLLALMSHIVACRTINEIRKERAQRRGGDSSTVSVRDLLTEDEATGPLQQAILKDCFDYYIHGLPRNLRELAILHLAGSTNCEIAEQLGFTVRTTERKVALLRIRWQEMAAAEMSDDTQTCVDSPSVAVGS